MNRNYFTEEQIKQLKSNAYTKYVSPKTLKFTDEFKELFLEKYLQGFSPKVIFIEAGYDPLVVGERRMANTAFLVMKKDSEVKKSTEDSEVKHLKSEVKALRKELETLKKNYSSGQLAKIEGLLMNRPSEKFELIYEIAQDPENTFSIKQLCELNHVSRSGYYSWIHSLEAKAAKEAQDRADFDLILQAFLEHGRKKGARQIYMVLQHMEPPVTFNLKKIRRLCRKYGLECPIRKANPYRRMAKAMRTDSVSDNLVERRFEEFGPRKILLTDITYWI